MENNGKLDSTVGDGLSTSSSMNLLVDRKDLDSPVGAKPEIGELEFERITENNTEVFGDDLMDLLKSDDGVPKQNSLNSSTNNNLKPHSIFATQEEEKYMMKELEQECYLLYNKIDRITKRLSDYECASNSLSKVKNIPFYWHLIFTIRNYKRVLLLNSNC